MKKENTTTKRERKAQHKTIIAEWQRVNAMKCAIKLLERIAGDTADPKINEMYIGLIRDQKSIGNTEISYTISDGYDVFMECFIYLKEMNREGIWQLFQAEQVEIITAKGRKKVSLWQGMRYHARHYIYKFGQTDFKCNYIEDFSREDKDGNELNKYDVLDGLIKAPQNYDIDSYESYTMFKEFLGALNLTARQKHILHCRLKGEGVQEIAKKLKVSQPAISKQLANIQKEVNAKFPDMVRGFKEGRKKA